MINKHLESPFIVSKTGSKMQSIVGWSSNKKRPQQLNENENENENENDLTLLMRKGLQRTMLCIGRRVTRLILKVGRKIKLKCHFLVKIILNNVSF